ncbi:MAG: cupin domain-containing protein [Thermomicrobiales bacterium]|nr:cupin domain-containing protein [Thermomicrobiales bacterium]MCC6943474.1 cupin domain-containing protein [Thermomicrobiales bacterium]
MSAEHQDNPIGTEFLREDEDVKIWRITLEPGEEAPWHTHFLDYTSIVVEGALLERYNDNGTTDRYQVNPGDNMRKYEGSTRHALKNVGDTRFSNVIIEFKDRGGPDATGS